ncbi:CCR4-associated factor 1 [Spatholobus suberectus]|nr:CCR4-associated factor 1 [Spatholobus suberectus]
MLDPRIPHSNAHGNGGNGGCGGGGGGSAEEGEESGGLRVLLVVEEQILGDAERAVEANDGDTEHESGDENRANTGEENDEDGERGEKSEGFQIREGSAEKDERLVRGAEEVKESPGGEEAEEEDEGERIGEERNSEDHRNDGVVVDAEVGEVLAHAERGFREGLGFRERGAVHELRPGAALVEAVPEGGGEVVDEGAEGGVVRRGVGARDSAAGLGVGDGEDGRGGGGHGCNGLEREKEGSILERERERERGGGEGFERMVCLGGVLLCFGVGQKTEGGWKGMVIDFI